MKYFTYIFRNVRRNPVRSILTIASTGISLFLMMILLAFFDMRDDAAKANRIYNRIITMNANGFAGMVPGSARSPRSRAWSRPRPLAGTAASIMTR
jgi:putative ABC transport system permease protein